MAKNSRDRNGQVPVTGLGSFFEQLSEKGFALVTMPIPITNDFTHDITALIDQESRREGPWLVKLGGVAIVV